MWSILYSTDSQPAMRRLAPATLVLAAVCDACDVCDGIASRKVLSGEVLDISDVGLHQLAPSHDAIALLVFRSSLWLTDKHTERVQQAFNKAAAVLKEGGMPLVMAQLDAREFPHVASMLRLAPQELPAVRILRGDPTFSYPLRSSTAAAEMLARLVDESQQPQTASVVAALDVAELVAFAGVAEGSVRDGTRVVANVSSARSLRAVRQVAHAFHGTIRFATLLSASPAAVTPHVNAPIVRSASGH